MIAKATALLLTTANAATTLRKLADDGFIQDGQWYPGRCKDVPENCAIQDDGYWFLNSEGDWQHFQFDTREVQGTRDINGEKRAGYETQDRNGKWTFIAFEKREGDGGYWMNDMEGQWNFRPYKKKHDENGGFGYWIENFEGDYTFIEYEKVPIDGGYLITHLDGSVHEFKNPVVVVEEEEPETFDPEGANQEQINDAASRAEAELACKIVGVAEQRKRRDNPEVDTSDEGNQLMSEEQADEYYINERVTLGDYSFDIRLKNAVKLVATSVICATLFASSV